MYYSFYTKQSPQIIRELIHTPPMQRLAEVGMNCGCEYTSYRTYRDMRGPYSRLLHSIGVADIVWNFTEDPVQSAAGLLHDIATPVFAHTIDFLHKDYIRQESTEDKTRQMIEESKEICDILHRYEISVEDVCDYHCYPIADNDMPKLSADRLEYTLGTAYHVYRVPQENLRSIYETIRVTRNESLEEELYFTSIERAEEFTEICLRNAYGFVSDEDRYCMECLAELVRYAMEHEIILESDLHKTEKEVIQRLCKHEKTQKMWKDYTCLQAVQWSTEKPETGYSVKVSAKKRYIDCLVQTQKGILRMSKANPSFGNRMEEFRQLEFDKWIFESQAMKGGNLQC